MASRQGRVAWGGAAWLVASTFIPTALAQSLSGEIEEVSVNIALEAGNSDVDNQRYTINLGDCRDLAEDPDQEIQFRWVFDRTPGDGQYTIKVQHDDETCATSSLTEEASDLCETVVLQEDLPSGDTLTERLTFEEITGLTDDSGCESNTSIHDVILIFDSFTSEGTGSSTDDTDFDETRFQFRTTRPASPTNIEAVGGESTIAVDWGEVDDAESYDVFYSTDGLTAGTRPEDVVAHIENTTSDSTELEDDIERNRTYYIAVSAIDDQGNGSLLSEVVSVTTQPVTDFYELYRGLGGREQGCCSTGSGAGSLAWLAGIGALALLLVRRRGAKR